VTVRRVLLVLVVAAVSMSGAGFAATLGVASGHLWAGSQTLTKGACTVTAATDTYADEKTSGNNSASTTLAVQPDNAKRQWAFISFDLSSCNLPTSGGADSATLKIYEATAPHTGQTLTLTPVLSSWPTNLPFATAQGLTYGTATASVATGTTNGVLLNVTVTADVDTFIKNPTTTFGWRISNNAAPSAQDQVVLNSADAAANKPQLVISYEQ
jgi:hypothetical protein